MNRGPLDRGAFETIEAYVLGRMNEKERAEFERRIMSDAELREEVELESENIRAVELGGIERAMRRIAAEERGLDRDTRSRRPLIAYAAAVVVLIIGGLLWFNRESAHERLFAAHYVADPGLPVLMGATDDPVFADAMVSYKEGHYADARSKWSALLQVDPLNDTLRFYIATSALAQGDAAAAIAPLDGLASDSASVFRNRAAWFLFLAYIRTGDLRSAATVDLSGQPGKEAEAAAILNELEH